MKLHAFWTVPLSIIRSFSLYTQHWYMSYRFADQDGTAVPSWSCSQAVSKHVWHKPLLCVQWKTPDDGQRNCPKHMEFHSKNKFEKLVHLVDFIIRNLTRGTVTWTSNSLKPLKLWRHDSIPQTGQVSYVYQNQSGFHPLLWYASAFIGFPLDSILYRSSN